jgi:hypothetical protein
VLPTLSAIVSNALHFRCPTVLPSRWRRSVSGSCTGDGQLRDLAGGEDVECHGVLWLLDMMEEAGIPGIQPLYDGLAVIAAHPRCRLPRREITIRIERYRVIIEQL